MTEEQTQRERFGELYAPVLEEMKSHSSVAETFIDTERYRIYLTTLWANAVARPGPSASRRMSLRPSMAT